MQLAGKSDDSMEDHLFRGLEFPDKSLRLINGEAIFKTEISYFCAKIGF
jgi:hypothetical protein